MVQLSGPPGSVSSSKKYHGLLLYGLQGVRVVGTFFVMVSFCCGQYQCLQEAIGPALGLYNVVYLLAQVSCHSFLTST